ncbi:hypothetical protein [Desulfonauticus submarinus]
MTCNPKCKFYPKNGYCVMALEKVANRLFTCAYYEEKIDKPDTTNAGKKIFRVCDYCLEQLEVVCDYERTREARCPKCGRLYSISL